MPTLLKELTIPQMKVHFELCLEDTHTGLLEE